MNNAVVWCRCHCGHEILLNEESVERYALIPEGHYEELIRNETQLFETENDGSRKREELFDKQSQRIGTLFVCPKCRGLIMAPPTIDTDGDKRYFTEAEKPT